MGNGIVNLVASEIILTVIEVYFKPGGSYSAVAHAQTWACQDYPERPRNVRIFSRGVHRVKLALYGADVANLDEWGAWLCGALINRNEGIWKTVRLSDCDR